MMLATEGSLHMLAGGLRVKVRVQNPQVKPRKDRVGCPWVFRYWADEIQPDGSMKTLRKYQELGPSKGADAITKKQAEVERNKFLAKLNAPTIDVAVQQVAATGVALFAEVARMYEEGYLGRENQIARPTREKEEFYIREYLVPKWGAVRLNQIQPKAVEDWLHTTFDSWWTMHGVRAIMTRIFNYAEGHGLWEEGKRSPSSRAKLGKKRHKRERRILSFEETARVLVLIDEPYRLIIETCIASGARISEVLIAQIRKLIDGHKGPPDYSALQLFCSWPVHHELDRGWAQKPIDYFNENCGILLGGNFATDAQMLEAQQIFGLSEAYDQLHDVLRQTKLAKHSRLFQPSGWAEFLKFYVEAVASSTLVIKTNKPTAGLPCANLSADNCAEQVTISIDKISSTPNRGSSMSIL